jgi:hypothetical protein
VPVKYFWGLGLIRNGNRFDSCLKPKKNIEGSRGDGQLLTLMGFADSREQRLNDFPPVRIVVVHR